MISDRLDPDVMAWLNDDVEAAPRDGLANALVATESVSQRPGWTSSRSAGCRAHWLGWMDGRRRWVGSASWWH